MSEGSVQLKVEAGVASVLFDRPQARNAMTWAMYQQLSQICQGLRDDPSVRVVTFRGAGGVAFVAGTDIEQFKSFQTGEDGLAYEGQIDQVIDLLESLPMPTVALIEGWAVGGGLAIATTCDFRIATTGSRLGVPIAKTLGNCLSIANLARLNAVFGQSRVKRMLMLAEMIAADEALACGYLHQLCTPEDIDTVSSALCQRLMVLAPVTQSVIKESLRRLVTHDLPQGDDLIRRSYSSHDFREGVDAFVAKRSPAWKGN
ncbi:MAG: enoyl-CoA hydratase/isomerase family protein [Burkholderiaceae bacterium]